MEKNTIQGDFVGKRFKYLSDQVEATFLFFFLTLWNAQSSLPEVPNESPHPE